ncbi:MAG TPA: hybrid sensor histidine kinase/response regulator [Noviherbaspirillum sp.]|nr:hybrid sensor histidine kinase/response regulator [Noviherbaspirillum sp.]
MPTPPVNVRPASVRADQITQLYASAPIGYCGSVIATLGACAILREHATQSSILIWVATTLLIAFARAGLSWRYARCPDAEKNDERWLRWFQLSAFAGGFGWGVGGAIMFVPDSVQHQTILLLLLMGMVTAGVYSYAVHLPTFISYLAPMAVGALIGQLTVVAPEWRAYMVFSTLLYVTTSILFARLLSRSLTNAIALKHQNAALAEELRKKSVILEQASLAKSRFLAAASHDLRQPVHALGLFLASLGRMELSAPARRTVGEMEACVAATGDLFASILDVSRLDAGILQPQPVPVAIAPFARRIVAEHQVVALPKGLSFRFRMSPALEQAYVMTDSQLLERIVRNLLQNAIRYTDTGGVLLAVRAHGPRIRFDVVDTGPGIPAQRLDDIFDEFVQLETQAQERHQGLGLGLAIVKRLCPLLDCGIDVVSRVGRGSRFRLTIEAAAGPRAGADGGEIVQPMALAGKLIVVLDDDPAIVRALTGLLEAWGAQVYGASSLDALLAALAPLTRRPDLIVSDLHLNSGPPGAPSDGLHAVAQIRDEFAEDIPAILITGETAPARLRAAYSAGLPVLHKPLQADALARHLATLFSDTPVGRPAAAA